MRLLPVLLLVAGCGRGAASPCAAWGPPVAMGRLEAPVSEVSGLVVSSVTPGLAWTLEDSGHPGELHAHATDGRHVGVVRLAGFAPVDAEALAAGPCGTSRCLYVADTGDNLAQRSTVIVARLPEPAVDLDAPLELEVTPEVFALAFPNGARDVEAMVVDGTANPWLLGKQRDGDSPLWVADLAAGTLSARGVLHVSASGAGGLPSAVTDAALGGDGTRLLVRTYLGAWEFVHGDGVLEHAAEASRFPVNTALELQGEALALDPAEDAHWQVAEGGRPMLWRTRCLRR